MIILVYWSWVYQRVFRRYRRRAACVTFQNASDYQRTSLSGLLASLAMWETVITRFRSVTGLNSIKVTQAVSAHDSVSPAKY